MAVSQPGNVQPTAGQVGRQFVSDLSILKPQYYDKFIEKYGSQKDLLLSLGVTDLVEDIENFEKVEYSKEDKSSGNGIIPLENTVSAEQVRLGKKYGVTYTLEDFLKEYDAELAALESKPATTPATQPATSSNVKTTLNNLASGKVKELKDSDPNEPGTVVTFSRSQAQDEERMSMSQANEEFAEAGTETFPKGNYFSVYDEAFDRTEELHENDPRLINIVKNLLKDSQTPAVVSQPAPAAAPVVAQTLTDAPVDALPADLFGVPSPVPQKPVSSTIELPAALAKYAVSPEKAAELNSMNPTGAPMQDLGDEIQRMCNPNI